MHFFSGLSALLAFGAISIAAPVPNPNDVVLLELEAPETGEGLEARKVVPLARPVTVSRPAPLQRTQGMNQQQWTNALQRIGLGKRDVDDLEARSPGGAISLARPVTMARPASPASPRPGTLQRTQSMNQQQWNAALKSIGFKGTKRNDEE